MKKVITYGTFDLFHQGHFNILKRARELGDYLIVGITTEGYDKERGKLNVQESIMKRIENVKNTGLVDEIIVEEYEGQKINDILKHKIDVFAIGSDWLGKFDYLKEYCQVTYLERTKGVSSTQLRNQEHGILKLGIVGYGRIAHRFIKESKFVSGVNIEGVYGPNPISLNEFITMHELNFYSTEYHSFLNRIDAVYIASPHLKHYEQIKEALLQNKHVLCEKPMVLNAIEAKELFKIAKEKGLLLLEAIKTAYSPGFLRLISKAKSGLIGEIKSIEATFTKLVSGNIRELKKSEAGGSVNELASYPLLAIMKLLGTKDIEEVDFLSYIDQKKEVDLFTKINIRYKNAIASAKVGLGVKSEGDLIIAGTKGYIYVQSPWWKTENFELRFEDSTNNQKNHYKFSGDGLRYELAEFVKMINDKEYETYKLNHAESIEIINIIEKFNKGEDIKEI